MIRIDDDKKIIFAVSFVAAIFFYFIFLAPQISYFLSAERQYKAFQALIGARRDKSAEMGTMRDTNRLWRKKMTAVEKKFISRGNVNTFLKGLGGKALEAGVKLKTLSPVEEKVKEIIAGVEKNRLNVTIEGSYENIIGFIGVLEEDSVFLEISRVRIDAIKDVPGSLEASFTVTMLVVE